MTSLTDAQRDALDAVRARARLDQVRALDRIATALHAAGVAADVDDLMDGVRRVGRVVVNFHPDRIAADGRMVIEGLFDDGVYRSQFETRISNGGLTAFPGGDRDRWEADLFGGAYQLAGVDPCERPKYGGLDLLRHTDGPCPRFGSCHLRLRPEITARTTFTFGDTFTEPEDAGTIDAFESVLASMLETDAAAVVRVLTGPPGAAESGHGRTLDEYIEAQVHGSLVVREAAEAIVADPSFRDTAVGDLLARTADRYGLELRWHAGFELPVGDVPAAFRGPAIPRLAARIARQFALVDDRLDAEILGRAARSVVTDPDQWADWGTPAETLQHIKQLWHVLVHAGAPARSRAD